MAGGLFRPVPAEGGRSQLKSSPTAPGSPVRGGGEHYRLGSAVFLAPNVQVRVLPALRSVSRLRMWE